MNRTIDENITLLVNNKTEIKEAIESKGVDLTGKNFSEYANEIIKYNGDIEHITLKSGTKLGWSTDLPTFLDFSMIYPSDGYKYMFYQIETDINWDNISNLKWNELGNTTSMFQGANITTIPDITFDALWYSTRMFYNCEVSDFGDMTFPILTNATGMFGACYQSIIFRKLKFPSLITGTELFYYCTHTTHIEEIDAPLCTNWLNAFNNMILLEGIAFKQKFLADISFQDSPLLTTESILSIAYACGDASTHTLTLSIDSAITTKLQLDCKLNGTSDGLVECLPTDPDTLGSIEDYIVTQGWGINQI